MANPNIALLGATYSGVSGVTLPKSGGGTATFPWVEGSETKTENGTYDVTTLAQLVVNVAGGGGGGLEYETGTWKPGSDIAKGTVNFSKSHPEAPFFILMSDATGTGSSATNSNHLFGYVDPYKLFGAGFPYTSSGFRYGAAFYIYRASSTSSTTFASVTFQYNSDSSGTSSTTYPRYWATESGFRPYSNSTSRYWRAGRTYKWIAVWKP